MHIGGIIRIKFLKCCTPGGESRGGGGDGGEGSSTWTISSERNQGNPGRIREKQGRLGWTISR